MEHESISFTGMHINFKDSFGGFNGIIGERDDGQHGSSDLYRIKGLSSSIYIKLDKSWIRSTATKDGMVWVVVERESGNYKMVAILKKPSRSQ